MAKDSRRPRTLRLAQDWRRISQRRIGVHPERRRLTTSGSRPSHPDRRARTHARARAHTRARARARTSALTGDRARSGSAMRSGARRAAGGLADAGGRQAGQLGRGGPRRRPLARARVRRGPGRRSPPGARPSACQARHRLAQRDSWPRPRGWRTPTLSTGPSRWPGRSPAGAAQARPGPSQAGPGAGVNELKSSLRLRPAGYG